MKVTREPGAILVQKHSKGIPATFPVIFSASSSTVITVMYFPLKINTKKEP